MDFLFLMIHFILSQSRNVLIFTSDQNSLPNITNYLSYYNWQQNEFQIKVYEIVNSYQIEKILAETDYEYTIDFTESVQFSGILLREAENRMKFNFVFGERNELALSYTKYTFFGSLTISQKVANFCNVILPQIQWTKQNTALLFQTDVLKNLRRENIKTCENQFKKIVYVSNNYENIKRQIGIELKAEGIRRAFILVKGGEIGQQVVRALHEKFLDGSGYAYGIVGESVHVLLNSNQPNENPLIANGLQFYVEYGTEAARSYLEVFALKIQKLLQQLSSIEQTQQVTTDILIDCWYNQDHTYKENLSRLNSQDGRLVTIRNSDDTQNAIKLIYPGGEESFDIDGKVLIEFCHFDGLGQPQSDSLLASLLALEQIGMNSILNENFKLEPYFVENSEQNLSQNFLYDMLNPSDLKGHLIALYGIWSDNIVNQIYQYEQQQNNTYTIQMHPYALNTDFTDSQKFPYLSRMQYSIKSPLRAGYLLYKFLNWKKTAIFYNKNRTTSTYMYNEVIKEFQEKGIEFSCDESRHGFYEHWVKEEFINIMKPCLDEIIVQRVRIINILTISNVSINWIMEYFADQGLGKGDILVITPGDINVQLQLSDLKSNKPLVELYDYSLNYLLPKDSYQLQVSYILSYEQKYGKIPSTISWLFYDAIYHFTYGLKSNIVSGNDYEIPSILNSYMKQIKFSGCSGQIAFEQGNNDRSLLGYSIAQYRFNQTSAQFNRYIVGEHNPLSIPFYNIPDVQWYDGNIPSDIRPLYKDWPFEKYQISTSENGTLIMYIVLVVGINIIVALFTALFWYIYCNHQVIPIYKSQYGMGDIIAFLLTNFEVFQLLSLSPHFLEINDKNDIIQRIQMYPKANFTINDIGLQMYIAYGIAIGTFTTSVIVNCSRFRNDVFFLIKILFSILFGFILQLPVITMLIDIYICTDTVNGTPFFDADWSTDCWDQTHIANIVAVSVVLILLLPSGTYIRIKFQEIPPDLNILWNPKFISAKTGIIVLMAILSKGLSNHQSVLVICLCVFTIGICVLVIILRPYNYQIYNLFQCTIYLIYIWIIGIFSMPVSKSVQTYSVMWIACSFAGIAWILKMKFSSTFPKVLYFPRPHKIEPLLRFQFLKLPKGDKTEYISKIKHRLSIMTANPTQVWHRLSMDMTNRSSIFQQSGNKSHQEPEY